MKGIRNRPLRIALSPGQAEAVVEMVLAAGEDVGTAPNLVRSKLGFAPQSQGKRNDLKPEDKKVVGRQPTADEMLESLRIGSSKSSPFVLQVLFSNEEWVDVGKRAVQSPALAEKGVGYSTQANFVRALLGFPAVRRGERVDRRGVAKPSGPKRPRGRPRKG